jgi:hypothetical protein
MPRSQRAGWLAAGTLALGLAASCASRMASQPATATPSATIPLPTTADQAPRDYPGIHNAVAFHDGFVSGSVPEGDQGFRTLAAMGIRTIISVDGAAPDAASARAQGMRYIHLPIGYNGLDDARKLELVRATRDAMTRGPVYIHCHHGKHRSAGAAAAIAASLGWQTPEAGVARMRVSGTSPAYAGLYACAASAVTLAPEAIDSVPPDFPEITPPLGLVKSMVEIDTVHEHLKAIAGAGWKAPLDHPDLVPSAQAGRLADLFRLLLDDRRTSSKPDDFRAMIARSADDASHLESLLASGSADRPAMRARLDTLTQSCTECHRKYRD